MCLVPHTTRLIETDKKSTNARAATFPLNPSTSLAIELRGRRLSTSSNVELEGVMAEVAEQEDKRDGELTFSISSIDAYHYSMASLRAKAYAPAGGKSCHSLRLLKPA